jgi:hypothetical protein
LRLDSPLFREDFGIVNQLRRIAVVEFFMEQLASFFGQPFAAPDVKFLVAQQRFMRLTAAFSVG